MKNQVIKNLTHEMGKEIIKYAKSLGVDTRYYFGDSCELRGDGDIYYGVIDGKFCNYTLKEVQQANATIIELPTTEKIFKAGELQYRQWLSGEWTDATIEYRVKPDNTAKIAELERQILEYQNQLKNL